MASAISLQEQVCPNLPREHTPKSERKTNNDKLPQRTRSITSQDPLDISKITGLTPIPISKRRVLSRLDDVQQEGNSENNGSSSAGSQSSKFVPVLKWTPEPFVSDCPAANVNPDEPEREFFMRCIVMGASDVGKYTLLDSIFSESHGEGLKTRNSMDLIIRTVSKFNDTKKYHFWVRNLEEESPVKEALWKTYYNWANAFVFVYDTTSRESLEAVEQAVKNVQQTIPKEKFFGILVGTKTDLEEQRVIDYSEVKDFGEKYGFSHVIETTPSTEKSIPQLLPRLETKLKLTFEAI